MLQGTHLPFLKYAKELRLVMLVIRIPAIVTDIQQQQSVNFQPLARRVILSVLISCSSRRK